MNINGNREPQYECKKGVGIWCKNCIKYDDKNDCKQWYNWMSGH